MSGQERPRPRCRPNELVLKQHKRLAREACPGSERHRARQLLLELAPTTSSSSAGATPSGRGSRRSSRRMSPSRRSRRTRSVTRGRCTSWPHATSARMPTRSPSTAGRRSTGARRSSSCAGSSGRGRSPATGSTRLPTRSASTRSRRPTTRRSPDWRRRWTARRSTTACTRTCGSSVCSRTDEGRERLEEGVRELWPYALGVLDDELRPRFEAASASGCRSSCRTPSRVPRSRHEAELEELLAEMTMVRRSAPAGAQW